MRKEENHKSGSVTDNRKNPEIVELVYKGFISNEVFEESQKLLQKQFEVRPFQTILFDTTACNGFAPTMVPIATRWMKTWKERGVIELLVATQMPGASMAATAVGFATGLTFYVGKTVQEVMDKRAHKKS